jgi:hypothetical protein
MRGSDGVFLGDVVLNEFDPDNASVNYRVWLVGPSVFGQGYGTEVTLALWILNGEGHEPGSGRLPRVSVVTPSLASCHPRAGTAGGGSPAYRIMR